MKPLKPRQPDRFERVVSREYFKTQSGVAGLFSSNELIRLLRAEHAWMRRMVRRTARSIEVILEKSEAPCKMDCLQAQLIQCEEFLDLLTRRRKGRGRG